MSSQDKEGDLSIFDFSIPAEWKDIFHENRHIIRRIMLKVREMGEFYPLEQDIFRAFNYMSPEEVKVVIVGQDPYPEKIKYKGKEIPRAIGMSFSQRRIDKNVAPSLRNIYKEVKNEYPDFNIPKHGDLSEWALQGVLFLNMSLTFFPDISKKSKEYQDVLKLWKPFIFNITKEIIMINSKVIFVLWGREAEKIEKVITGKDPIYLRAGHPSPVNGHGGFLGCRHFKLINDILERTGQETIDWTIS